MMFFFIISSSSTYIFCCDVAAVKVLMLAGSTLASVSDMETVRIPVSPAPSVGITRASPCNWCTSCIADHTGPEFFGREACRTENRRK